MDQQFNEENPDYWSFRSVGHCAAKSGGDGDGLLEIGDIHKQQRQQNENKSRAAIQISSLPVEPLLQIVTQPRSRNLI